MFIEFLSQNTNFSLSGAILPSFLGLSACVLTFIFTEGFARNFKFLDKPDHGVTMFAYVMALVFSIIFAVDRGNILYPVTYTFVFVSTYIIFAKWFITEEK